MSKISFGAWIAGLALAAAPLVASAQGTITSKNGEVQSAASGAPPAPAAQGQRVQIGDTVTTGSWGSATLRFEDGLVVALNEHTSIKLLDYRYGPAGATRPDGAVFELLEGAVRVVTGSMVQATRDALVVRGPQAALVSGGSADFTVVLVNPMYVSVTSGSIVAVNNTGRTSLGRGSTVEILNSAASPLNVMSSALPGQAAMAMRTLRLAAGTPGGPLTGAAPTTAGASGSGFGLSALGIAAGAAAAAAALGGGGGGDGGGSSTPTHH